MCGHGGGGVSRSRGGAGVSAPKPTLDTLPSTQTQKQKRTDEDLFPVDPMTGARAVPKRTAPTPPKQSLVDTLKKNVGNMVNGIVDTVKKAVTPPPAVTHPPVSSVN